jgi:hypothetical protein
MAKSLDHLEEVVRTVDLVHFAGLRIADDDAGAVNPERTLELVAGDPLGFVLGSEVGVLVEILGLVEHVFTPGALEKAGGGDRTGQMEMPDLDPVGELDCVQGAFDVREPMGFVVGFHVVNGSQVVEVVDLAAELFDFSVGDPEVRLSEVANDRLDPSFGLSPTVDQLFKAAPRALPHEHVDSAAPLQETLDQIPANEARSTSYEVIHRISSRLAIHVSRDCPQISNGPDPGHHTLPAARAMLQVIAGRCIRAADFA